MTSTIALPMAVTSNVRLFICEVSEEVRTSSALEVLAEERRQFARGVRRNRVRSGDQRVFECRRALARALRRQAPDGGGDELLRGLRGLRQAAGQPAQGHRLVVGVQGVVVG